MQITKRMNRAQAIVSYLVFFILIAAALFMVSKYIRNSMSGKIRQAGDSIGGGGQYDPGPGYGHYHSGKATEKTTVRDKSGVIQPQ